MHIHTHAATLIHTLFSRSICARLISTIIGQPKPRSRIGTKLEEDMARFLMRPMMALTRPQLIL